MGGCGYNICYIIERLCPGGSDDSDWSLRLVLETFTILERHDLAELEDERWVCPCICNHGN